MRDALDSLVYDDLKAVALRKWQRDSPRNWHEPLLIYLLTRVRE